MKKFSLGVFLVFVVLVLIVANISFISFYQKDSSGDKEGDDETIDRLPETHTVFFSKSSIEPNELRIKKGDSVRWINQDSGKNYDVIIFLGEGKSINSGRIFHGDTYTRTFDKEGEFRYFSDVAEIEGSIIVDGAE